MLAHCPAVEALALSSWTAEMAMALLEPYRFQTVYSDAIERKNLPVIVACTLVTLELRSDEFDDKLPTAFKLLPEAQEKPVLLAQKLAEHDHKKYRSEELAVAKEVALLSEHPSSKKLRAKVDKLVKHSKEAKKRMAEDGMLLKKREKKTADAQLGGERWALYRACVFCLLVCARTRLKLLGTAATEQQLAARLVSVPADTESARQDGEMDSGRRHGRP